VKKNFDDCLKLIKSKIVRKFVREALALAPKQFWIDPCSSSGKYHPPEDQVEGGIIVHSRKAVQVALSLFRFFDIKDQLVKDKIIAACILHDIQKNGIPWKDKTDYEHGPIAADWLMTNKVTKKLIQRNPDLIDIVLLIKNHMGIWNKPNPTPALKTGQVLTLKDIWHLIIQIADYWASRKWCSFICDEFEQ